MVEDYDPDKEPDESLEEFLAEETEVDAFHVVPNKVSRGDEVNLMQKDPAINEILVGVGWDLRAFEGDPLDLDVSVFLLNSKGKTREDEDFVFYNNLSGCNGDVRLRGDSRTGAGEGDDEMVDITLNHLPFDIQKIVFVLSIYDLNFDIDHDFSMVKNVYFRLVNQVTDHEMFRYVLDEDIGDHTGLIIGELERVGPEWIFKAIGDPIEGGLSKIASEYGIVVAENMSA